MYLLKNHVQFLSEPQIISYEYVHFWPKFFLILDAQGLGEKNKDDVYYFISCFDTNQIYLRALKDGKSFSYGGRPNFSSGII